MITNIFLGLLLAGIIYLAFFKKPKSYNNENVIEENARLKADLSQKDKIIGELTKDLQNEKTAKDQLSGKNKQMFVENTNLKAENDKVFGEKERLAEENTNFKLTDQGRTKELENNIKKLNDAKLALEDEKLRVRREDEEKLQKEREERDRMWAEHEESVKARLFELCKTPQYSFSSYDNKNLPIEFGGKFKPDFLLEFLKQYVIFDAKISKSDNLQDYINNNVKTTVEKIGNNPQIYQSVFFVVPTEAMKLLKKIRFYEKSYDFFVIPPEALEIILAFFKKISSYELAEQLDPRDRENIVNLISEYDYHINMRNAIDILVSESGVSVLKKADALRNDIKTEIDLKKSKMRLEQFAPTDIKTLMLSTKAQKDKINGMVSPKAPISENNLKSVKPILGKKDK